MGHDGDIAFTRDGTHAELLIVPAGGVLATGAGGSVGSAVTQIAKWKGGRTIGVDRRPISPERQQQYGIDHFLVADANESYKGMIDGASAQRRQGVNGAFDCVGGPLFEPCLRTLGHWDGR